MSMYDEFKRMMGMGQGVGGYYQPSQSQLQGPPPPNQLEKLSAERMRQMMELQQQAMMNMAVTPERKVKDKVKKALEDLDVYYSMPVTGGYGNAGVPDFLVCVQGRFFGIECKAGNNTTTALQEKHLSDIRAAGGVSLVIDETNVDNVTALILANLGEK